MRESSECFVLVMNPCHKFPICHKSSNRQNHSVDAMNIKSSRRTGVYDPVSQDSTK